MALFKRENENRFRLMCIVSVIPNLSTQSVSTKKENKELKVHMNMVSAKK